jgi:hypothetical protein
MKAVSVTVANGNKVTVASRGSAAFSGVQETVTLTGARFVPGQYKNLTLVQKLIEKKNCLIESKRRYTKTCDRQGVDPDHG